MGQKLAGQGPAVCQSWHLPPRNTVPPWAEPSRRPKSKAVLCHWAEVTGCVCERGGGGAESPLEQPEAQQHQAVLPESPGKVTWSNEEGELCDCTDLFRDTSSPLAVLSLPPAATAWCQVSPYWQRTNLARDKGVKEWFTHQSVIGTQEAWGQRAGGEVAVGQNGY